MSGAVIDLAQWCLIIALLVQQIIILRNQRKAFGHISGLWRDVTELWGRFGKRQ